jgi:hypothetical protein
MDDVVGERRKLEHELHERPVKNVGGFCIDVDGCGRQHVVAR